ncbi:MAG: hypothetical protein JWM74_2390, partial [Myxococcaceae bacterium]|nr:hypothetical protein [Myxococcaceae bacterium]
MTKPSHDTDTTNEDDDDVHSARTVPPPAGGDAYADATVVREVPADILAAIEPPEEKLGALTAQAPRPVAPASRPLPKNASGLPSVVFEDEDEDDQHDDAPASSPLLPAAEAPELAHVAQVAGAPAQQAVLSRSWLIGLLFAAALVMWTL